MVIVVAVVGLLMAIAAPATIRAMNKAKVGVAMSRLDQAMSFAQRKAQAGQVPDGIAPEGAAHYGVAIYAEGGSWFVTVTHGQMPEDDLADFKPLPLGAGFEVWTAADDAAQNEVRLDGRIGWFYQYGSGYPILTPLIQRPQAIGTPAQAAVAAEVTGTAANQTGNVTDRGRNFQVFGTALVAIPRGLVAGSAGTPQDCSAIRLRQAGQGPPRPFVAALTVYPIGMSSQVVR